MDESEKRREKSLEYSLKDGTAFSVMTGFGEQYFSPLAIEMGASNMQIGLLASVPIFVASLCQLYTSKFTEYFKSRRRIITNFVMLQALTWIPLMLIPALGFMRNVPLFIFFVVVYFVFGQFVAPVWNSLMGDLVRENTRGSFFGMRNKITGAVAFAALFIAGFVLSLFPKSGILYGFAAIFAVAFLARLASWYYLAKMDDPPSASDKHSEFTFTQYLVKLKDTNYGRFALYLGFMSFSVNIASPFFTVYMLRDINMTYFEYTIVTAAVALTSFLAMTYWGPIADRFGNKKVMNVCGILVSIVPVLWLFSKDIPYLIFAQVVSGFAWAGFNLATANFIFDNVRPSKRTRVFSYHSVVTGTLVFAGAVTGGLLSRMITSPWVFYSKLQILFLISGVMRAAVSIFFLPMIQEVRDVEYITGRDFFLKYSGSGPIAGLTYRAVTGFRGSLGRIKRRGG